MVEFTARGSGYYRVFVNGEQVSQHVAEREAVERAVNEAEDNPDATIYYDHDYEVDVLIQSVANGRVGVSAQQGSGVQISWTAPTTSEDGSALSDLDGFIIHYGTSSGNYTEQVDVSDPDATSHTIEGLASGTWYFSVRAYDDQGAYSEYSDEVSVEVP